jgi:hypothetical protein
MFALPAILKTKPDSSPIQNHTDRNNIKTNRDIKIETLSTQYWLENNWQDSLFYEYHYNVQGKVSDIVYKQKTNGIWQEFGRFMYQYNQDLVILLTWQQKNGYVWNNNYQYSYQYDNQNLLECAYSEWVNGIWLEYSRGFYTYDANDNLITEIWQYWQDEFTLVNWTKNVYEYHENGEVSKNTQLAWNIGAWVNYEQYLYTYVNDNLTNYHYQYWENNQWNNSYRYRHLYDGNNRITESFYDIWSGSWLEISAGSYVYDEHDNVTLEWWQTWENGVLVNYIRYLFGYIEITATNQDAISYHINELKVFPNPFYLSKNRTAIDIFYHLPIPSTITLELFNLKGQKIKTFVSQEKQQGNQSIHFTPQNLITGVYFLLLKSDSTEQTQKIIILK